jgi:8-oxo-dGTP pyrophosphatase MutT (NUDIX family)
MSVSTHLASSGVRATRKASGLKGGLGNVIVGRGARGGSPSSQKPLATTSISYVTPGTPKMPDWDADWAIRGLYLMNGYVMRGARTVADTISGLPFRAGADPTMPVNANPDSPLAKMLGPATAAARGGPNPTTSSRALWAWSLVQFIVTGRWGWETIEDKSSHEVFELWPLVSCALFPIPSSQDVRAANRSPGSAGSAWWDGFEYNTPLGRIPMQNDRVFYAWRPSALDWREPESDLQAARIAVQLVVGIERYMWSLMTNQMVARKLVITPPFDEPENRRAFEESFLSEFTGFDNAGRTIFAEAENDYDESGKMVDKANIQVVDLATKGIDAQMREVSADAKNDILIALGVPRSLIGDAAQRIYANSNAEYRNFWILKILPMLAEIQDPVNVSLAPRIGSDMGWFDLSNVVAVQPPTVFQPPSIVDAINEGVVTPEDVARILNITAAEASAQDLSTIPIGEEATQSAAVGGRSAVHIHLAEGGSRADLMKAHDGWRAVHDNMRLAPNWYVRDRGRNAWTVSNGVWKVEQRRERASLGYRHDLPALPQLAEDIHFSVARIRRQRELGIRSRAGQLVASGVAVKAADTGRLLMLQRSNNDPTDPARGTFEFPGGHIEPGEDSFDAAMREWSEETGCKPPAGQHAGMWTSPNGVYRGHVFVVPSEASVPINVDPVKRKVLNPDDPDHDDIETAAWMHPKHITEDNPAIRKEVRKTVSTWGPVVAAARGAAPALPRGRRSVPALMPASEVDLSGLDLESLDRLGDALAYSMNGKS